VEVPSIHSIRSVLKTIPGAIEQAPLPEDVSAGTGRATEIHRIDPEAWDAPGRQHSEKSRRITPAALIRILPTRC
jgi:hypothetical protein